MERHNISMPTKFWDMIRQADRSAAGLSPTLRRMLVEHAEMKAALGRTSRLVDPPARYRVAETDDFIDRVPVPAEAE